ncbi:hypothetical protein AB0B50_01650 [Streptomyces sp. NPDC041068]|uniref:hypothetical protein n=1 Tax=Streptomyces sp. NPDC041068 TaxID=3155130 RepID=UPI0033CFA1B5
MSGTGHADTAHSDAMHAAADFGSVPDWVGAVGTAAATLLLAVGLLREIRRRRLDDARAAAERRAAEANQARLVSVLFRVRGSGRRVECVVRNDSSEPIRDAVPWLSWTDDPADGLHVPEVHVEPAVPLLGPRDTAETTVSVADGAGTPAGPSSVRCAIAFTDADGRRWIRAATGAPMAVVDGELQALTLAVGAAGPGGPVGPAGPGQGVGAD